MDSNLGNKKGEAYTLHLFYKRDFNPYLFS